ncbi:uncharacterized protein LOC131932168 [Physella acuta]|uniref:uncharacterized protein LOC131932168 n=1 Tax=Physella acuta TaxID=109671 RepID=UPI0027DDAB16|nr:uncharacterized protein LOC131932168 [Physella acuta]
MLVLLLLTVLVRPSLQVIAEEDCKPGELFHFYDNQCYYLYKDFVYWNYVKTLCSNFSFVPARVRTAEEIAHFTEECSGEISIGATDEDDEGVFKWIDTLQPISSDIVSLIANIEENSASKNCLMGRQESVIIISCSSYDTMCGLCTERNDTLTTTTAASDTSSIVKTETTPPVPTTTNAASMNGQSLIFIVAYVFCFQIQV